MVLSALTTGSPALLAYCGRASQQALNTADLNSRAAAIYAGEYPPAATQAPFPSALPDLFRHTGVEADLGDAEAVTRGLLFAKSRQQVASTAAALPPAPQEESVLHILGTPSPVSMDPRIREAASKGQLEDLRYLLNWSNNRNGVARHATAREDTVLHVVATNGDDDEFLMCATLVKDLLFAINKQGDTPVHCAARAGNFRMVSHLIELVGSGGVRTVKDLLEIENDNHETALHEAVRVGNNSIVEELLRADQDLACIPRESTSPMYLAILLEQDIIAETLHTTCGDNLSYRGPNKQNALHAAVLRSRVLTEKLLQWKKDLAEDTDANGSTPLHFAAALPLQWWHSALFRYWWRKRIVCQQVLDAYESALFQSDQDGLFPIHVAASVGQRKTIAKFVENCASSAGLCDAKGRTFLHVAVEKKKTSVVGYACRNRSLAWILNMRNNDGNTALHLAVMAESLPMFCSLLGNKQVQLNLTNAKGETPLDLSRHKIPRGIYYNWNSYKLIYNTLCRVGAKHGCCREDLYVDKYTSSQPDGEKESDGLTSSTQTLGLGAVLIATMTFGTTFGVPGGYIADDHPNGGSPTLGGRYGFDEFVMANTIAFMCSSIATVGLMYSGSFMVNLAGRRVHFGTSVFFLTSSVTSLVAAFALGVYMVLSPIAHKTAIAICLISPLVVVYRNMEYVLKQRQITRALCNRIGPIPALKQLAIRMSSMVLSEFWPFIVIFTWGVYARSHRHH